MDPVDELVVQEIRRLLDEELNRLPVKYRTPFVLCYLAGQTHEEAAQALGCPRKTITTRLTRAREQLRSRLVRRGLTLASAPFAGLLSQKSALAAGLPIPNADLTARMALQFITNAGIAAGTVSAPLAALARGVLTAMALTKIKTAIAVLFAVAVFGSTAGLFGFHAVTGGKDTKPAGRITEGEKTRTSREDLRASPDQEKKQKSDKELLRGTWVEESRGADGMKVAESDRWKLVFDEDKVTWTDKGKDRAGTFTVDPDRKPKEIDLSLADPTLVLTGIYELKGDTLKTLWRENDRGGLPNTFDAKEGLLIVLKRKKAD
jgi:uncharacterized protein (TIGR03067 family)